MIGPLDVVTGLAITNRQGAIEELVKRGLSSQVACRPGYANMRRAGLTLLELLVVLAIMGVIASMLLAAVQHARESARRAQCTSNLRQIGIALQGYQDAFGVFPRGWNFRHFSFHVAILPQLEQEPLFQRVDYLANAATGIKNSSIRQTALPVYECPSDGYAAIRFTGDSVGTSYVGNYGTGVQAFGYNGFFPIGPGASPAAITDGLSQTAALSEILVANLQYDRLRVVWPTVPMMAPGQLEMFAAQCAMVAPSEGGETMSHGHPWTCGDASVTLYNHILPPNRPSCRNGTRVQEGAYPPASMHPGGVNVTFGDGHLKFIVDDVDLQVWRAFGSRNGNEAAF